MIGHIHANECVACHTARKDRCRVLSQQKGLRLLESVSHTSLPEEKIAFSKAPALYSFNVPKYFAILLRAREFAKTRNIQLTCCYARDIPMHPSDRELKPEALNEKRLSWLQRHDQDTGNITSLLPLAVGMPIRLTDNVDRNRQLYRGRRGFLHAWTLHPESTTLETNGEMLIDRLPLVIYVIFPEADWHIGELPRGVYPITPRSRTWQVNKRTGIQARRKGYTLIPDFASTAHMIQGATLETAFTDLLDATAKTSLSAMIAAYVCLSRVKELRNIVVMQPFCPSLFTRGPPTGPARLIRKLVGKISSETAVKEWLHDSENPGAEEPSRKSTMEKTYNVFNVTWWEKRIYVRTQEFRYFSSFGVLYNVLGARLLGPMLKM